MESQAEQVKSCLALKSAGPGGGIATILSERLPSQRLQVLPTEQYYLHLEKGIAEDYVLGNSFYGSNSTNAQQTSTGYDLVVYICTLLL